MRRTICRGPDRYQPKYRTRRGRPPTSHAFIYREGHRRSRDSAFENAHEDVSADSVWGGTPALLLNTRLPTVTHRGRLPLRHAPVEGKWINPYMQFRLRFCSVVRLVSNQESTALLICLPATHLAAGRVVIPLAKPSLDELWPYRFRSVAPAAPPDSSPPHHAARKLDPAV